jgi:UDP-2-acetamido-2-deoxy-ribo-hexuluronate aminotransferase
MPFLEIGASEFNPDFMVEGLSRFQIAMAFLTLDQLGHWNEQRRKNAEILINSLKNLDGLKLPKLVGNTDPVYLRFPILVMNSKKREKIYSNLLARGIGVSKAYPTGLSKIREIEPYLANGNDQFPNADLVSASLLTLPTNPFLTPKDLDIMIEVIQQCL